MTTRTTVTGLAIRGEAGGASARRRASVTSRIIGFASAAVLGLLLLVPVAAAADPGHSDGRVVVTVHGETTFGPGERADVLVVADGTATIKGDVDDVYVFDGTVQLVGGHVGSILAFSSTVRLDGTSVVRDVRVVASTIQRAPGATVQGSVTEGIDAARFAILIAPALFVIYLGFVIATMVGAIALAAVASRQVRDAELLISREPGATFLASLAGLVAIVAAGTLAIVTIVGIPLGLAILVVLLPLLAVVGYLVAGIWIGEWLLRRVSPSRSSDRPYLAAIVGTAVLGVITIVPFVGALIGLMGFGAVTLLTWRTVRRPSASPVGAPAAAPVAG